MVIKIGIGVYFIYSNILLSFTVYGVTGYFRSALEQASYDFAFAVNCRQLSRAV